MLRLDIFHDRGLHLLYMLLTRFVAMILCFISLFSLFSVHIVSAANDAARSTPCSLLNSSTPIPAGWGAAYNVFSRERELLLTTYCANDDTVSIVAGSGMSTQYIYKYGYERLHGHWENIVFRGNKSSGDWFIGSAQANLFRTHAALANDNEIVAYVCTKMNSEWKCGCRDVNHCVERGQWQLQTFRYLPLNPVLPVTQNMPPAALTHCPRPYDQYGPRFHIITGKFLSRRESAGGGKSVALKTPFGSADQAETITDEVYDRLASVPPQTVITLFGYVGDSRSGAHPPYSCVETS